MTAPLPPAPHDRGRWVRARAVARGVLGVAVFLASAAEELLTAAAGMPRPSLYLLRAGRFIADEYRVRAMGAVDADVIDDQEETA